MGVKGRVVSLRIEHTMLAQCYTLLDGMGVNPTNMPLGKVIGTVLDMLMQAGLKAYSLPVIDTDEEADQILDTYLSARKLPGIVPKLSGFAASQRRQEEENQATPGPAAVQPPGEHTTMARFPALGPVDSELVDSAIFTPIIDVFEPAPSRERMDKEEVLDALDSAIAQTEAGLEEELRERVSKGRIYRESPDEAPAPTHVGPPWEGAVLLPPEELKDSKVWLAAQKVDDAMCKAVQAVYAAISQDQWDTDQAIRLVKQTYKQFKEWKGGE